MRTEQIFCDNCRKNISDKPEGSIFIKQIAFSIGIGGKKEHMFTCALFDVCSPECAVAEIAKYIQKACPKNT